MFHFQDTITNTKGDALIGYFVKGVDPETGDLVDLYADNSATPIIAVSGRANAAKVDSDGMVDFYVPSGSYHLDIYATDGTTLLRRRKNIPMFDLSSAGSGTSVSPALTLPRDQTVTIDTGSLTISTTNSFFAISAETGTADTISTITGGTDGRVIVIRPLTSHTITLTSGGNLDITQDVVLSGRHTATLIWDTGTAKWDILAAPGVSATTTPTRSTLAAIPAVAGANAFLAESGREGGFVFRSGDQSALVTADTAQGIYVAPSSDTTGSSGVWIRNFTGPINLKWFGIVGGNASGANGAANYAAWLVMLATLRARIPTALLPTFLYQPLEAIYAPMDWYEFSTTLDLTNGTGKIIGDGTGAQSTISTTFKFPAGQSGFRTQRYNSEGSGTTSSPTHLGGDSWLIDGISVYGGYYDTGNNGAEGEYHGFEVYSQIIVKNFRIFGFQGDGIYISSNTTTSLADSCHFEYGRVQQCRRGRFATGGDSNVCTYIGISYGDNRTWGIEDNCFLGSTEVQPHVASNGWDGAATSTPTACTNSGNRYYVKIGQATGASTNAPSGTTADNTWWGYIGAGGASNGIVAWVSGTTFREGGSIKCNNANSRMEFSGAYTESDQNPYQGIAPLLFVGGLGPAEQAGVAGLTSAGAPFGSGIGSKVGVFSNAGTVKSQLGGSSLSTSNAVRAFTTSHTTNEPTATGFMWGIGSAGTFDTTNLWFHGNDGAVFRITSTNTATQFGRGAAQPKVFHPITFALGSVWNGDTPRIIGCEAAAPTTGPHAAGEVIFNNRTSTTKELLWSCSAAATPGTWEPMYRRLYGSATYDPPSLATATQQSTTVTVTGAAVGDGVSMVSFSNALSGTRMWGEVTATNTVTVYQRNDTGGTLDLASGTLRVEVVKQ